MSIFEHGRVLAIVGSTELAGNKQAIALINDALDRYNPVLVVSGGAAGVDRMAIEAADVRGIKWQNFPPKEQNWERQLSQNSRLYATPPSIAASTL